MEVVVSMNEFHFDSTISSPYVSAPSSPSQFNNPFDYHHHHHHYSSAPTSPRRVAQIYASSSVVPFDWEQRPGTPKSPNARDNTMNEYGDDFAFEFNGQLEKGRQPPDLTAADELFEEGMIRPLKPPPRLYDDSVTSSLSPRSPKSPNRRTLWSPQKRDGEQFDPFTAAMVEATRERGRERGQLSNARSRSKQTSRSLSPMRGGVGRFFRKESSNSNTTATTTTTTTTATATENMKSSSGSRKWRLRDLLLFRSASEGRATGNRSKDPLNKYTVLSSSSILPTKGNSKRREDSSNTSFRSTESNGGSTRKGKGATVSAHEKHYVSNRAATGELKKKTPLPYRQGLFGCLRFNPAVNSIARGFYNSYSFGGRQY